jgi:hypothetical protein
MFWNGTSWSLQTLTDPEGAVQSTLLDVSCTPSPNIRCTAVGAGRTVPANSSPWPTATPARPGRCRARPTPQGAPKASSKTSPARPKRPARRPGAGSKAVADQLRPWPRSGTEPAGQSRAPRIPRARPSAPSSAFPAAAPPAWAWGGARILRGWKRRWGRSGNRSAPARKLAGREEHTRRRTSASSRSPLRPPTSDIRLFDVDPRRRRLDRRMSR